MFNPEIYKCHVTEKVEVVCDTCNKSFQLLLITAKRNAKRNQGKIECQSCSAKRHPKPQNSKEYWTKEKRECLSKSIVSSDIYYESIRKRNSAGQANGMFGKKHSEHAILAMVKWRTGRKQSKQTVARRTKTLKKLWAGREKKSALNCRIRFYLHKQLH